MNITEIKNNNTFSFFGTTYKIFFDMNSYDELMDLIQDYQFSEVILGRYKRDIKKLLLKDDYFIGLSSLNNRIGLSFFVIINKDIFKFDPIHRKCKNCENQLYLAKIHCLEVYSGIRDKIEFDKHQEKLSKKRCPICENDFEREYIALIIE